MKTIFDSRNEYFKYPFGAVEVGESVHIKITLPRYIKCSGAYFVAKDSITGDTKYFSMYWCGMDGYDHETWECDYSPLHSGVLLYYFSVNTDDGMKDIYCMGNTGVAKFFYGEPWQLTIYDKGFKTPLWLKGATMYQIFPDRFYRGDKAKPSVFPDRRLRDDWGGEPEWRPDENGNVTNNDYFGGDLRGVIEKLDYLEELGVTCIYLNPIFEAHSNHRYNTANYMKIDPFIGTEKDYEELCSKAKKRGIRVILDGVFSHTGSDSIYFNKEKRYDSIGAVNSENSPYKEWYHFIQWPDVYHSWWGFDTLPELEKANPEYDEFINGKKGVVRSWIKKGCSGWRLDVADELPDCFLDNLREAVKSEDPNAIIVGEVWEDASNKESYGVKRRYLLGKQLDSVMNYPFRNAILSYLKYNLSSTDFCNDILTIVENYPKQVLNILMNNIGTHDTERAITILAGEEACGRDRPWQSETHMSDEQIKRGITLMKIASAMQFTLPGVPCIYYGDEAGSEGYKDPFNRYCYPWGKENKELVSWYKKLGKMRKEDTDFSDGDIVFIDARENFISYRRGEGTICAFNRGNENERLSIPNSFDKYDVVIGESLFDDEGNLLVPAMSSVVIRKRAKTQKKKDFI